MKRLMVLLFILLVTTGCVSTTGLSDAPPGTKPGEATPSLQSGDLPTATDFEVSGNTDGAPAGCGPSEIAHRAAGMFAAISRGEPKVVDEYMGKNRHAPFEWYSMTEVDPSHPDKKNHFVAYNLDDLATYFNRRQEQNERLRLLSMKFNGWESARGIVHIGPIELTRHADDLPEGLGGPERRVSGKGAYHCKTQAFIVLSFAMTMVR